MPLSKWPLEKLRTYARMEVRTRNFFLLKDDCYRYGYEVRPEGTDQWHPVLNKFGGVVSYPTKSKRDEQVEILTRYRQKAKETLERLTKEAA